MEQKEKKQIPCPLDLSPEQRFETDTKLFRELQTYGKVSQCLLCHGWKSAKVIGSHITGCALLKRQKSDVEKRGGQFRVAKKTGGQESVGQTVRCASSTIPLLCDKCDVNLGTVIEGDFVKRTTSLAMNDWGTWSYAVCHTFRHLAIYYGNANLQSITKIDDIWTIFDEMRIALLHCLYLTRTPSDCLLFWLLPMPKRVQLSNCRVSTPMENRFMDLLRDFVYGTGIVAAKLDSHHVIGVRFYGWMFVFSTTKVCSSSEPTVFSGLSAPTKLQPTCNICQAVFESRNKLMTHVNDEHSDSVKPSTTTLAPAPQPDFLEQLIASNTQQIPNDGARDIQFDGIYRTITAETFYKIMNFGIVPQTNGVPLSFIRVFVPAWHVNLLANIVCNSQARAMDLDTGEVPDVPNFLEHGEWQELVCLLLRFMITEDFQLFINVVKSNSN
jgi:hypothetical protein